MPVPVNNANTLGLDQRVVAATIATFLNTADDYASDFSNDFVAPINGQRTSTVLVRLAPVVATAPTPATRDGLLARTGVTAGSVEVGLTGDDYFKVGIDTLGVDPGTHSAAVGTAGAQAIVKLSNTSVLTALEGQGTAVEFPGTYGAATTGQQVWTALLGIGTSMVEADYEIGDLVLYIRAGVWAKLIEDVAALRGGADPRATAATLLGVGRVRIVAFPTATTLATIAHPAAIAAARVLSGVRQDREDFDEIVEGRIKYGTKVIEAGAVRVLRDAAL